MTAINDANRKELNALAGVSNFGFCFIFSTMFYLHHPTKINSRVEFGIVCCSWAIKIPCLFAIAPCMSRIALCQQQPPNAI